jgi:hypothetical protein
MFVNLIVDQLTFLSESSLVFPSSLLQIAAEYNQLLTDQLENQKQVASVNIV